MIIVHGRGHKAWTYQVQIRYQYSKRIGSRVSTLESRLSTAAPVLSANHFRIISNNNDDNNYNDDTGTNHDYDIDD